MGWWYGALRPLIRRGYQPSPALPGEPEWICEASPAAGVLLVFCPTYAGDGNQASQLEAIDAILAQVAQQTRACVLMTGMQYVDSVRSDALRRLEDFRVRAQRAGVPFCGFLLRGFGKVRSVNVALAAALRWRAAGLLQIDDDIYLEPGCIGALVEAFERQGCRGAVGASKTGQPRRHRASRLLLWLKGQTRAACNYPHACCMLLEPSAIAPEIPSRYVSDDGYICFTLLRPAAPDPFELLRIAPDARCRHFVGGRAGESMHRIRRLLLNHHVLLSDFPVAVAEFYVRRVLFPGFRPVGAAERPFAPLRWILQLLYFLWFLSVGIELALRGALRRPLVHIHWAGFPDRAQPREART
jgi:hypothetical protein